MFGILNCVFAVLGVIGMIASLGLLGLPADSSNPVIQLIRACPGYGVWLKSCIPLGMLGGALLLATGFGLLSMKPWARTAAMASAIYLCLFFAGGMLINLLFMDQPMLGPARQQQAFETVAAIGGPISGTIGGLLCLIYPVLLLAFMLQPKVISAFRAPVPSQTQA
ncbi:MAG TPA: hypothetical protein VMA35_14700 [Candidatus Sulfopaludibacter sp.]|nr:hypothetical protein [Candidatus Sulfopaludibacter sp.]